MPLGTPVNEREKQKEGDEKGGDSDNADRFENTMKIFKRLI
jgi:hypothetical protein